MKTFFYPEIREKLYYDLLPCGLPIYIISRPGYQKKHVLLAVCCGGGDRSVVKNGEIISFPAGTAHFLEHKMFDMPEKNLLSVFSSLGADVNAFTGPDITGYHFTCTERFEECFELLLRMVLTPFFTPESVEKERGIITQEIKMISDRPRTSAYYQMLGSLYPCHPAFENVAGTANSISEISADSLFSFYEIYYRPSNMALCVIGDVDPNRIIHSAAQIFPSQRTESYNRLYPVIQDLHASSKYLTTEMDISVPEFCLGFRAGNNYTGTDGLKLNCISDCAVRLLFAQSSSLYQELYQLGLIGTDFGGSAEVCFDKRFLLLQGKSKNPRQIFDNILKALSRFSELCSPDNLIRQKRAVSGAYLYRFSNFNSLSRIIVNGVFRGYDPINFSSVLDEITEKDILKYINTMIESGSIMSAVLPKV